MFFPAKTPCTIIHCKVKYMFIVPLQSCNDFHLLVLVIFILYIFFSTLYSVVFKQQWPLEGAKTLSY